MLSSLSAFKQLLKKVDVSNKRSIRIFQFQSLESFVEANLYPTVLALSVTAPIWLAVDKQGKMLSDQGKMLNDQGKALTDQSKQQADQVKKIETLIISADLSKNRIDNLFFSGLVLVGFTTILASLATVVSALPTLFKYFGN